MTLRDIFLVENFEDNMLLFEELYNSIEANTKNEYVQLLKNKISTDDKWCLRALKRLYNYQTNQEKNKGKTIELNNRGFSGKDSEFLSSLARSAIKYGSLTEKQMIKAKQILPRYSGQLLDICMGDLKTIAKVDGKYKMVAKPQSSAKTYFKY